MKIITTDVAAGRFFDETAAVWKEEPDRESKLVTIYPEKQYQTVLGFGGAFTQAAGYTWSAMSSDKRSEAVEAYFSDAGLGYENQR